jgi:hypothetical protein
MNKLKSKKIDANVKKDSYIVGKNYFIRALWKHYTGKLIMVTEQSLIINKAAYILDDGRFMDAMKTGVFAEVEPYPEDEEVLIAKYHIQDAHIWNHPLPRTQI